MDINKIILVGRITKDAELKYTANGTALSNFSIATNRRVKKGENWEEETSFFNLTVWGKTAEKLNQYLTKGKQIGIEGSLNQDRFQKDGQQRSVIKIKVEQVQLLGSTPKSEGYKVNNTAKKTESVFNGNEFEDDIPF